jgi:hypothetical protein
MPGPAISYDKLFDFPGFFKAMDQAETRTVEFGNLLGKVADRTKSTLSETLSQVSNKKVEIIPEKELSKLQEADKYLNDLSSSATRSRDAINGLEKTTTIATDSISALKKQAKDLVTSYEQLSQEERNNVAIGGELIKSISEIKNITTQYNETVRNTTKSLSAADSSYNQMSNDLARMRAELKNMPGAFDASTGALNKNNKEAVNLANRIKESDAAIKKIDSSMGQFFRNVGNYEGATVSLRQQMRQMTLELIKMEQEGKRGTQAYSELVQKAGELQDTMSDVSSEIRRVGSDTATIEGMVGIFQGIAGAAAIAEGATALFGVENEDLVKSIQKLQGIQAIMMGIQSVANMLQKESAAVLLVTNLQRKLEIVNTNLQTAAQSKNIIIKYAAIAVQKILNSVIASNPAGLLVTVVLALAGAILILTSRSRDAAKQLEVLNRIQNSLFDSTQKNIELMKMQGDERLSAYQDQIKEAKAAGASQIELMDLEIEAAAIRRKNASEIQSNFSTTRDDVDLLTRQYERQREEVEKLELTTLSGDKKGNALLEQKKKATELVFNRLKAVMAANNEFANADLELDNLKAERLKLLNEISLRDQKAVLDTKLARSKEESENELNIRIQLMEVEKAKALTNVDLTEKERQAIIAKYSREETDLRNAFDLKQKENALKSDIAYINGKLALSTKGSMDEFALKIELIEKTYELEKASIEFSIKDEDLKTAKLKELYDQQLADKINLEREKRKSELEQINSQVTGGESIEILKNQQIIASEKSTLKEVSDARLANEQINIQRIDRDMALNQQMYDEQLISHEEYENRKTEITIEQEELRLKKVEENAEREKELRQSVYDTINMGVSAGFELFAANQEAKISKLEDEKKAAITAAGDNADAKARIEANYNKKIAAEKRKAAVADKAAALFQVGIDTAMGIMSTIRKWGMPFAIPFIALVGLQGLLQAAIIAAKPIPKYKRGIESASEGLAIVNDEPGSVYQEMIMRDNKGYIPAKRNQMVYLKRGDKVIRAAETKGIKEGIMRSAEIEKLMNESALQDALAIKLESGRRMEIIYNMTDAMMGAKLSEKKIGDEVGKYIEKIPQPINIWDERGHRSGVRKGNSMVIYLNDRNSL